jgi:hypothetical protein
MSDSYRRYSADSEDLGSTTREDAKRWRAYMRSLEERGAPRKRAHSTGTMHASTRASFDAACARARATHEDESIDAREMFARIIAS